MKVFCWVFILSVAIISPLFSDLYPFSTFPMFSDNANEHLILELSDLNSNRLEPLDYGLQKIQIANREQRYGFDLGPNYFDQHNAIDPQKVRAFLRKHFPSNRYPIFIEYRVRGFDPAVDGLADIVGPEEFVVDLNASNR